MGQGRQSITWERGKEQDDCALGDVGRDWFILSWGGWEKKRGGGGYYLRLKNLMDWVCQIYSPECGYVRVCRQSVSSESENGFQCTLKIGV